MTTESDDFVGTPSAYHYHTPGRTVATLRVYGDCQWMRPSQELEILVAAIRRRLQRPVDVEAIFFVENGLYGVQLTLVEGANCLAEARSQDPDLFVAVLRAVRALECGLGLSPTDLGAG